MPAGLLMYAKIIELKKHPTAILLCEILEYGVFTEQLCHYFTSRTKPSTPSHGLWLQVSIITRSSSPIILRTCHVLFGSLGLCSASWRGSNGTRWRGVGGWYSSSSISSDLYRHQFPSLWGHLARKSWTAYFLPSLFCSSVFMGQVQNFYLLL